MPVKRILVFCIASICSLFCFAQSQNDTLIPKGAMGGVKATKLHSTINGHDYTILVKLPDSYTDTVKKKYSVVYALDGQWSFPSYVDMRSGLVYDNLIEDFIFVGIAFPQNWFANRNRDFTPTHTDFDTASGGAPKFLEMLTKEVIPYINSTYRTDPNNNGIVGNSSGGLFVLYAMFQQPSPFKRFMANSPALWYDNLIMSTIEKEYAAKRRELPAKLFLSLGGYEAEYDPPLFQNFVSQLSGSKYKGLELDTVVIEKTGHVSSGYYALIRGLEFLYHRPDIALTETLLEQYAGQYEQGMSLVRKGKALFISVMGKEIRLSAVTDNDFYVTGQNGQIEFRRANGKISGFQFSSVDANIFVKKL